MRLNTTITVCTKRNVLMFDTLQLQNTANWYCIKGSLFKQVEKLMQINNFAHNVVAITRIKHNKQAEKWKVIYNKNLAF